MNNIILNKNVFSKTIDFIYLNVNLEVSLTKVYFENVIENWHLKLNKTLLTSYKYKSWMLDKINKNTITY